MATSGTITGTVNGNSLIKSKITWTENSYSIPNNTSSVTVKLIYYRTDSQTTYGTGSWVLNINGTKYTGSSYKEISHSEVEVFSKTVTITHDSNGAKTFSMNASGSYIPGTSLEGTNCSGSGTLTTIPRASTISLDKSSVNLGAAIKVTISAKASFYHKITWTCGSATSTTNITTAGSTSSSFTVPANWAGQITTATSKTASVKVQTYSNQALTTTVGSPVTKNFTITVPNTATYNPTVSLAITIGNEITNIPSTYFQGKTKANLSATGGIKYGATIKSYVFTRTINNSTVTLKTDTTGNTSASASETTNTASSSVTYSVKLTDSRGRIATADKTITVNAYSNPLLTINSCYRCDSTGTKNTTSGTYFYTNATFSCSTAGGNQITSSTVKYKPVSSTAWEDGANITSNEGITLGNGQIATNTAYTVYISVVDKVGTVVSKTLTIPTIFVTMDFKAGGTGVAIGKIATEDNLFDVGVNMRISNAARTQAALAFLADGFDDVGVLHSMAGNFGFFNFTNNTWLYRIDTNKNAFLPGDSLLLGESSDNTTKDLFLQNSKRKTTFTLNISGDTGLYDSSKGWIMKADSNNNVSIPNGRFSAPKSFVRGTTSVTVSENNKAAYVDVSWTEMSSAPTVVVTPMTSVPHHVFIGVSNITTTGCRIHLARNDVTSSGATGIQYIAIAT